MSVFYIDDVDHALIKFAVDVMSDRLEHCIEHAAANLATRTPHCGIDCDDACRVKHVNDTVDDIAANIALSAALAKAALGDGFVIGLNALDLQTPRIARALVAALDLLDLEDEPIQLLHGHVDVELTPDEVQQRSAALYSATMKAWPEVFS